MIDDETVRRSVALAPAAGRTAAAGRLAEHLGALALLMLIEDRMVEALVPAPGFPQTLPGGAGWREFLRRIRAPGSHRAELPYPKGSEPGPVYACTAGGLSTVLVAGPGGEVASDALARLEPLLPLLAALFQAEYAAGVAQGEVRAAQSHARDVEALVRALDAARAEIERTVQQLERESRAADDARARAEEATRAKDEFLAMLGHELRNPLSPILTALQLMRLKNQHSREQDIIERQVSGLMRLVDDLLDVSRITRGKIELRKERIELADVAARAVEIASPLFESRKQVLHVRVPRQGLLVEVDPSRMAQVFGNLLTNASKYSEVGTEVVFAADRDGPDVRIQVRDQGIGIAPEMLSRVFDLFVQQRQSVDRSRGGLGLGLAIVRTLVEMHGGAVAAISPGEGCGSEFVVRLPAAAPLAGETTAPADDAGAPALRPASPRTRVLVVDDNDDGAMMLAEALGALGYQVRTAPDGPAALRLSAAFDPAIAILDIGLPVMDGYELAESLRKQHGPRRPRLIAVTGYGQANDRRRTGEAGFEAHLVKPISLEQLQGVLEALSTD